MITKKNMVHAVPDNETKNNVLQLGEQECPKENPGQQDANALDFQSCPFDARRNKELQQGATRGATYSMLELPRISNINTPIFTPRSSSISPDH
jgi:hypothetical protein